MGFIVPTNFEASSGFAMAAPPKAPASPDTPNKDANPAPEKRLHFTVGLDLSGCSYDARINDVSVMEGRFPVVVDLPVNEWVIPGDNRLSLRLTPMPGQTEIGESAKAEIRLQMRPKGCPRRRWPPRGW